jgi:hypothetical protein
VKVSAAAELPDVGCGCPGRIEGGEDRGGARRRLVTAEPLDGILRRSPRAPLLDRTTVAVHAAGIQSS